MKPRTVVTVFGSANVREGSVEYATAHETGRLLAQAGYAVCNGGYGGTMEASAKGAREAGGATIGVVAEVFGTEANKYIGQKVVVKSHVDRLLKLIELGDAYIVLPGGTGTLLELAMVWEYMNKGLLGRKPFVAVGEVWAKVVESVQGKLVGEGRVDAAECVRVFKTPHESVNALRDAL